MSTAPLLVLDLDGTIAETAGDLIGTLNTILMRDGLSPLTVAEGRMLVGAGAKALIERGFAVNKAPLAAERLEALFEEFLVMYEARIAEESTLFPGLLAALDQFEVAGWRLAVCTNKVESASVKLLAALGVAERFAAICGRDTFTIDGVDVFKPDARALFMTIERAGGDPSACVMVGDSRTDIQTAKNAGIPVVAVDFGYTDVHVSQLDPDVVISHFDDLWSAVAGLREKTTAPA
jgi:phosphoglycolate phosphatase